MSSNLKTNVNKMRTRPAAYYELLKSKMMNNQVGDYLITKQVLGY